jgi:hypothetical protein
MTHWEYFVLAFIWLVVVAAATAWAVIFGGSRD